MFLKAGEIISNNKIRKKRGFVAEDETIVFNLTKKAIYGLLEKWRVEK